MLLALIFFNFSFLGFCLAVIMVVLCVPNVFVFSILRSMPRCRIFSSRWLIFFAFFVRLYVRFLCVSVFFQLFVVFSFFVFVSFCSFFFVALFFVFSFLRVIFFFLSFFVLYLFALAAYGGLFAGN